MLPGSGRFRRNKRELSFQYKRQIVHLNYDLTGNTEGSTILLIHGFLSSNAQWMPNIEALGRDHKLVLVELWGHGESPTPEAADFTIERYDHELEQIRLELGINQWSVVGQSYAAGLVVRYSINHPERTHRIVVTNSRSAFSDLSTHQRHSPQEGSTQIMKQTSNRHLPIHPIHAKRLPEGIKTRLVEMADNISSEAIDRGGLIARKLNVMDIIDNVTVPMMLTNGIYEKSFQPAAAKIKEEFPAIRVADLLAGHAVNIEAADEFNKAVLDFIN